MRRLFRYALWMILPAMPAHAGIYTDDLTRCVVAKAGDADKLLLVRWIFAAMSVHPAVDDLAKATPGQRQALNSQTTALIVRLIIGDCHAQSVAAIKYEGADAIRNSFEVLGRVAMVNLMTNPAVQQGMKGLNTPEAEAQFQALAKEAGVPTSNVPVK